MMKKSELKLYRKRWDEVHRVELALLRKMTMQQKVLQFLSLMASAHTFGVYKKNKWEIENIQKRWQTLRKRV